LITAVTFTNNNSTPPNARKRSGLKFHDVLFVLFKHKWKILFHSCLGFAAAAALIYRAISSPDYETQATLLVRYVLERSAVDPYESKLDASGTRGMSVMDAEIEIIKSADLAHLVAGKIGPARLLPHATTPPTQADAALVIIRNLRVMAARGSDVIHLSYRNPDPELAVIVLSELIDNYFAKHLEIHRSTGAFESVARQTDQARSRLSQTENELRKLNHQAGVLSFADSRIALEARRNAVRSNLSSAQVDLAEQQVKVATLEAALGVLPPAMSQQSTPTADSVQPDSPIETLAHVKAREQYHDLADQLSIFKQRRNQIIMTRKPGDAMILALDRQITAIQQQALTLIEQHPQLAEQAKTAGPSSPMASVSDLNAERARLAAIGAKVKTLTEQSQKTDTEVERLSAVGVELTNLERRRQLEEEKYRYFETSLEKARVDEALNPASMPNIGVVQKPSTPIQAISDTTKRIAMALAASGIVTGLALAFLIEWVLDRRVSRPIEIQTRLQLPLMMSIPRIRSKDGMSKLITLPSRDLSNSPEETPSHEEAVNGTTTRKDPEHFITPYAAAIRDRIMFNFELNNITHKPKLIALTGLCPGAGTTTLAAGLAKAFAENGKHKVLLVDFSPALGDTAQQHASASLRKALDLSQSERFRQNPTNLYLANAPTRRNGRGATQLASSALHDLMPQLEASNFDYVIFDLPAVGPTSPSLAIAGFMDKVLLILDAEKTNRETLSWSYAELEKGRADVSCVFNKAKSHAPRWVAGEI
jgi:polysaccharide biosynthesis transport protein